MLAFHTALVKFLY